MNQGATDEEARVSKEDLENILNHDALGGQVPLRSVADVSYSSAPREINRRTRSGWPP